MSPSPIARLAVVLILAGVPLVQSNAYWVHVFSLALIGVILAFSQQLLVGMAGIVSLGGEISFYYVSLIAAAAVFLAFDRITHSRFGRALIAMSQDEEAARASGVAIAVYKSKCFLVAAIASGIAGGLYAYHSRYLNPNDFS